MRRGTDSPHGSCHQRVQHTVSDTGDGAHSRLPSPARNCLPTRGSPVRRAFCRLAMISSLATKLPWRLDAVPNSVASSYAVSSGVVEVPIDLDLERRHRNIHMPSPKDRTITGDHRC